MNKPNYFDTWLTKPEFDFGKTRERLATLIQANNNLRKLDEAVAAKYPRMGQSVANTASEICNLFIQKWKKGEVRKNSLRFTYSYLQKRLAGNPCIATLKNHLKKIIGMYKSFIKLKFRDTLGLPNQNTACICLVIQPGTIRFKQERYNEAWDEGELDSPRFRAPETPKHEPYRMNIVQTFAQKLEQKITRVSTSGRIGDLIPDFLKST